MNVLLITGITLLLLTMSRGSVRQIRGRKSHACFVEDFRGTFLAFLALVACEWSPGVGVLHLFLFRNSNVTAVFQLDISGFPYKDFMNVRILIP